MQELHIFEGLFCKRYELGKSGEGGVCHVLPFFTKGKLSESLKNPKTNYIPRNRVVNVVAQRCSVKKMFLETPQNLHKNACARASFLIKF